MENRTLRVTYLLFFLVLHSAAAGQKFTHIIKFAAAFNGPSGMATSFPGIVQVNDVNNDIVIRGNSPISITCTS